jgi:crotonobetainyl-CoA:carnitine CoA-transferase CaiB-like acyl-CoA transferase
MTSDHLRLREFFQEVEHPIAGTLKYPGPQWRMSEVRWSSGRAPLLGEHNKQMFCEEVGLSAAELALLRAAGVV